MARSIRWAQQIGFFYEIASRLFSAFADKLIYSLLQVRRATSATVCVVVKLISLEFPPRLK